MTISNSSISRAGARRRAWFATTAIAGAVALALAGGLWAVAQANATAPVPVQGSAVPRATTDQFADVVERVKGAVVNVSVAERLTKAHGMPRMTIPEDLTTDTPW